MSEIKYMQRALELAALGTGSVSPNPLVGCVIVFQDIIIGEGWHQQYGGPHAEVNAVNNVSDPEKLKESTVYVTLEPCSHFGKTPPCADLLIRQQVKKVVICNIDPFPLVAGKGIQKLKDAGIEVETGLLEKEGRHLNRRFFKSVESDRPYIILKWAETADGFLAGADQKPLKITGAFSDMLVHKWRSEEDAIMVGTNTAAIDNPSLNVRHWEGKNPVRILIDSTLKLDRNLRVFDQSQKTIIFNTVEDRTEGENLYIRISKNSENLSEILDKLHELKIRSVFVEGGATLLNSFIRSGLFDEIRILKNKSAIKSGIPAPHVPPGIKLIKTGLFEEDELSVFLT
ncbi:bifunctional diaminohydroxyphosphoribosylaminopyrimidine deaminase/5-amino-6-(5-phosphoribosylamino)uracil reductase RibD [Emticicia sp. CRIBPO]|nr:bifunctional diaminohydroxyphosphoribosylaminopyrimidine deaminase/5-amino-6-(5-phosphoribosylamino)uracil reductase RibD [Emticicia sp. CRIBPO]